MHDLSFVLGHVNFKGKQLCEIIFEIEDSENTEIAPNAQHQDTNKPADNIADSKTSIEETAYGVTENTGSDLETLDTGNGLMCFMQSQIIYSR